MSTYYEDLELVIESLEKKNRDPKYIKEVREQGEMGEWGVLEFDEAVTTLGLHSFNWGGANFDTIRK